MILSKETHYLSQGLRQLTTGNELQDDRPSLVVGKDYYRGTLALLFIRRDLQRKVGNWAVYLKGIEGR